MKVRTEMVERVRAELAPLKSNRAREQAVMGKASQLGLVVKRSTLGQYTLCDREAERIYDTTLTIAELEAILD